MRLSRRNVLFFAIGAAGAGIAYRAIGEHGIAAHALDVISEVYGPEFAAQDAAHDFAEAYEAFVLKKGVPGRLVDAAYRFGLQNLPYVDGRLKRIDASVIEKFAMSTNVILAAERGEPLVFVSLFHPYQAACMNQLGASAIS